jgi:hypothetical protein
MIKKGNKTILLFFYLSCELKIWEIALVIINIKTHQSECENTMFIFFPTISRGIPSDLLRNPRVQGNPGF